MQSLYNMLQDPAIQSLLLTMGTMAAVGYYIIRPPKESNDLPSGLEQRARDAKVRPGPEARPNPNVLQLRQDYTIWDER